MTLVTRSSAASILDRNEFLDSGTPLSSAQIQIDSALTHFSDEATDIGNLLAMSAGGLAFRGMRTGLVSAGVFRTAANLGALGTEAVVFRTASQVSARLRGQQITEGIFDAKGLATTMVSFGTLKGVGVLASGQNALLAHTAQASAMVAANQVTYGMGLTHRPEGSLVDQLVHAEVSNMAMIAGNSVLGMAIGNRLSMVERSLEVQTQAAQFQRRGTPLSFTPELATQAAGRASSPRLENILMMSGKDATGGARGTASNERAERSIPADWPQSVPASWREMRNATDLWSPEKVTNNRGFVKAITKGVLTLLGEHNVLMQFGYGSGFDKFDPEASVKQRDPDNKFDLVVVVDSFASSLTHLGQHWGFEAQKTAELVALAEKGGVFCPNPDMLVEGFGLLGFKLTIVSRERFYANVDGRPALNFAQFRLKDTIIADENNPSNRLLWIRDPGQISAVQTHINNIRDHMLDIAFHLRGSFAPHYFKRSRYTASSITMGQLTEWMYELSYNIEGYRVFDWGKSKTLFEKRANELAPFMLEAARRFAARHAGQIRFTYKGTEVSPEQITAENLYKVQLADRHAAATQRRYAETRDYTALLLNMNSAAWIGSKTAMGSLRYAQSYEHIDNATYGGRKMRKPANEKGAALRLLLRPLVWIISKITSKVDSVNYPVLFTEIAIQTNALYRKGKLNDQEWDVLNRAWMANPEMTRMRNIEILEAFERNLAQDALSRQAYIKFLDSIANTPYREPAVVRWARQRKNQISRAQAI